MGTEMVLGLVLLSSLHNLQQPQIQTSVIPQPQPIVQQVIQPIAEIPPTSIMKPVKKLSGKVTFADLPPILKKVAQCESGARQYYANGKVVTNKKTHDYGLMQINQMHIPTAKKLGYNIFTEDGNVKYALYLYNQSGLDSWSASRSCWA